MKIAHVNQMKLVAITMAFAMALCQYGALALDTNEGSHSNEANESIASIRFYTPSKVASLAGGKNLRGRRLVEWGDFRDDGFMYTAVEGTSVPVRRYASVLWGIPDRESWESTCAETPATVNGHYFPHPSACAVATVSDSFEVLASSAILTYVVGVYVAEALVYAAASPLLMESVAIVGATTFIVDTPQSIFDFNVWGVFYVSGGGC